MMQRKLWFAMLAALLIASCTPSQKVVESERATLPNSTADKVAQLLATLTLEDKVGEMTQLSIDMISVGQPYNLQEPHTLDTAKLREVLVKNRVGSILNAGGHAYTREHWLEIMNMIQSYAAQKPSGIPVLYGIDAIHGPNYTLGATLFPQQIGIAATWNPALGKQLAEMSAYETRACGIPWNFSPVLDLGRDPRWPRLWETFGEDVYLARQMGVGMIQGYQGDSINDPNHVAACMKHFIGYSMPWTGRDRTPAYVPDYLLREYFLPTFQDAIAADAKTVMINSGELNGIPVHVNKAILTDLLRDELGFEGVAVTDWEDIHYLVSRHRVAVDYKDAIRQAINAGIDMSMVPLDVEFAHLLKELVEEGKVPMSRIDEAVTRILTLKFELGLFDSDVPTTADYPDFASPKHTAISRKAAEESLVLLKNENNLLPLSANAQVMVSGPTADDVRTLNGGWTYTWQGNDKQYFDASTLSILQGIRTHGGRDVPFVQAVDFDAVIDVEAAKAAAQDADVLILCLGEATYTEKPGDINSLDLSAAQVQLAQAMATLEKPMVLVLAQGRPRIISAIEPLFDAIVWAPLPGNQGGRAVGDLLYGKFNPSGRLPITYPSHANALLNYDHKGTELIHTDFSYNAFQPQYEFGHGLSYTTYEYSELAASATQVAKGDVLTVSVRVTNLGERTGLETVQLYVTDKVASVTPAVKRLRAFKKVEIAPGETEKVIFELDTNDLSFIGRDGKPTLEAGAFELRIGDQMLEFTIQ